MKILLADKMPDWFVEAAGKICREVINQPKLTAESLETEIKDADILVVRSTEVSDAAINNAHSLSLIIRAGAGVNNINMKAANQKGVYVSNCPGKNSIAVAELTMALIAAIDRRIADNVIGFREGKWNKALYSKADGLFGKTIGIIGTGQIGVEVIQRAKSFGLNVIAWSRSLTIEKAESLEAVRAENIAEVFEKADIVSIHLAQNNDTKNLVNKSLLSKMKAGAMFINTSRAGIVVESDLIEILKEGKIFAGLDVFKDEPEGKDGAVNSPLRELKNVYVTHHIGASTTQAQDAVAEETLNIVKDYIQAGTIRNWVNRCKQTAAKYQLVVRHFDKPGVLAQVLNLLSIEKVNAQEMENVIFDGEATACCTIKLDTKPSDEALQKMRANKAEIINAALIEL